MEVPLHGAPGHHFEWDPAKASSNLRKHGVSFGLAAAAFEAPLAPSVPDEESGGSGERWVTMGQARDGRLLVAVHTWRAPDEDGVTTMRIISARPATPRERRWFEQGK